MTASVDDYQTAFATERVREYPGIDDVEARYGFKLARYKLEYAARILACPVKANPPNWQHGRVLYAVARRYLASSVRHDDVVTFLDIGTAKGFSALVLEWALCDAPQSGRVCSVDVIDPAARIERNTVADANGTGLHTLAEILAPWPEAGAIHFECCPGTEWLVRSQERVHFAFVDGKHRGDVVRMEAGLLDGRQRSGDVIVFDDVHIPGVMDAVATALSGRYHVDLVIAIPHAREYAIATKR